MSLQEKHNHQVLFLGGHEQAVHEAIAELAREDFVDLLWRKDPRAWRGDRKRYEAIQGALGWLDVPEKMQERLADIDAFVRDVHQAGFTHVLLMGMGGSSMAPLVITRSFPPRNSPMVLNVLDTTDPSTIVRIEESLPLSKTLFIVASKSGTTAEPNALVDYFYAEAVKTDPAAPGRSFAAITDPGSPLARQAAERRFRKVFLNYPDIGGRYSALSLFGLLPAALYGIEIRESLAGAQRMAHACRTEIPVADNPAVLLGAAAGQLARSGRDKLTLLMPDAFASFGMWLEQLVAESTGKNGVGILPVAGEPPGAADEYGNDRFFIYFRFAATPNRCLDELTDTLRGMDHPVAIIDMRTDPSRFGEEFFRWEIATAVAGRLLDINPFDQPNVQESKDRTNRLLAFAQEHGGLPEQQVICGEGNLRFFGTVEGANGRDVLRRFFAVSTPHEYMAFMAYGEETDETTRLLQDIQGRVRRATRLAVTAGYGPRYLHSTGQYHKGGPPTGRFLLLVTNPSRDREIPDRSFTFGTFMQAQAAGDMEALGGRGRPVLAIHLGTDLSTGLRALSALLEESLGV